ncbi:hypothetical protein CR513_35270, partial [Mucuna pruriens]
MYETILRDLGVTLPFDYFAADVLQTLGVAPLQLHPNRWATMQAFRVIYQALAMIRQPLSSLVITLPGLANRLVGCPLCLSQNTDSRPLSLYWKLPIKFKGLYKGQLSLKDRVDLQLLEELPRGMNCKELKQGFDMEALIRKAVRVTKAKAALASTRDATAVEKEAVPTVAEKELDPNPKGLRKDPSRKAVDLALFKEKGAKAAYNTLDPNPVRTSPTFTKIKVLRAVGSALKRGRPLIKPNQQSRGSTVSSKARSSPITTREHARLATTHKRRREFMENMPRSSARTSKHQSRDR